MEKQLEFEFMHHLRGEARKLLKRIRDLSMEMKDLEAEAEFYELRDDNSSFELRRRAEETWQQLQKYQDRYYNLRRKEDSYD